MSAELSDSQVNKSEIPVKERDKEVFPIYPLFVAVFPVLAVYSANLSLVPLAHLFRPLLAAAAAAVILQALLTLILRDRRRGAAVTAVLAAWSWSYSWLAPKFEMVGYGMAMPLFVFGALVLAGLAVLWRPKANLLNLVTACITGFSAVNVAWLIAAPLPPSMALAKASVDSGLPEGPRPDIFHIVLDGFGRADVLKDKMDLDISEFVKGLNARGFTVLTDSRTTYVQTELSVSSTLNMDLLPNLLPSDVTKEVDRRVLKPLVQDPAVAKMLMASGYRYMAIGSGFDGLWLGRHQLPDRVEGSVTLFEGTLLSRTPWQLASGVATSQYDLHREKVKGAFAQLEDLAAPTTRPKFVVAHILAPHPPFVFGENGESVRPKGPFGFWDGSDYLTYVGSPADYKAGYQAKLRYVMKRLTALIDKLQANGRKPIIILQGDHGSKVGLDQNSLSRTDLKEAFCNFYAVSVPKNVPLELPEKDTSVNTYRRLLTALGAEGLTPYPPQSFYSTAPRPFVFTEVSNQLED